MDKETLQVFSAFSRSQIHMLRFIAQVSYLALKGANAEEAEEIRKAASDAIDAIDKAVDALSSAVGEKQGADDGKS
ncbi:hypothetical protein [Burkholderia ubonensis]|uniref:hypothetical protein n=1 Tax=Burkholderia ubonensis TaxID=101571 RepID=UPI0012FBCB07|nr:hypothetical protein [Burkholderia ubonensis]